MANTHLETRIEGTEKRIEKILKSIARLEGLIVKKQAKINSGKEENNKYPNGTYWLEGEMEWHRDDIKRANRELAGEQKKLADYKEKAMLEKKKQSEIPHVESVEQFLAYWREEAYKHYTSELKEFKTVLKGLTDIKGEERFNILRKRFSAEILNIAQMRYTPKELENKLNKMLNDEVNRKRIDLFARCSAVVGLITDASNLKVASNSSLNGFIIGEKGKAEVETIFAGGYNIQCLHYRVLVKKIK
jgi:chromosome segregation ATPase